MYLDLEFPSLPALGSSPVPLGAYFPELCKAIARIPVSGLKAKGEGPQAFPTTAVISWSEATFVSCPRCAAVTLHLQGSFTY